LSARFAVDVLNRDARAVLIDSALSGCVNPIPQHQGEATGKPLVFGVAKIEGEPREIEGQIEAHDQRTQIEGNRIEPFDKLAARQKA
jgi:hypothetical protein